MVLARLRLPDILGFLALGVACGPFALGIVHLSLQEDGIGTLIALAASLLLYEGGRGLDVEQLRPAWFGLLLLVTAGVAITAALAGVAAHVAFGWEWQTAILFGCVLAGTDPAAVIPVMRQVRIAARVSNVAQAESAFNDATSAILTVVAIQAIRSGVFNSASTMWSFIYIGLGGIAVGIAIAAATAWIAHGERFREQDMGEHDQQLIELITVLLAYGIATYFGSSGYMAAFAAGLVHSRSVPKAAYSTESFFSTTTFLSRLLVFVVLGASFDPKTAALPVLATLGFIAVFMFVVRPLAVFASLLPDARARWTLREMTMLSWVRETGVIPAALAANVAALALPSADSIVAKTAAVIVITVLVQGLTTGALARRLRLSA